MGPNGTRTIAAEDFFVGTFTTAMEHDEVLTEVRLPRLPAGTGVAVEELARRHGDFAIVGAMAAVHLAADGSVDLVRIAASGVDSVPVRLHAAEAVLAGGEPTPDAIDAAAATVATSVHPTGDVHAPASYRRDMAQLLVRRAVAAAIERIGMSNERQAVDLGDDQRPRLHAPTANHGSRWRTSSATDVASPAPTWAASTACVAPAPSSWTAAPRGRA